MLTERIRAKLDYSVDPCNDFYKFVCNSFRGQDEFLHTIELVKWMISLNLDFYNTTRLAAVNPVEVMVRGSLDLGLYIMLYIAFEKRSFTGNKRDMEIGFSKEQDTWLQQRDAKGFQKNLGDYSLFFLMFGIRRGDDYDLAARMIRYEQRLMEVTRVVRSTAENPRYMVITQLGNNTDPYVTSVGALDLVGQTERMVSHIRNTFMKVILNSSWVGSKSFAGAIQKLDDIVVNVGSPGRRLDVAFIENHFRPLGDVPVDRLFPSWIKALSISAHYVWSDQETPLYDEEEVTARYFNNFNIVIIPTALIHQPLMYPDGPIAMNYGGLGMLSLSRRQEALDDTLDSENLADLVGTSVAYKAFTSLVPEDVGYTLPGLDMSAEQLFFVMNCAKWCSQYSVPGKRYAPFRSRCIVPLMNMDEFASAFRCALGTPMNPPGKCFFW
ncbi:hypothetical protein HPB52_006654 [Rhipicephalus sanguineus]|uniref:Peptidase M13 C-terminal domain-containing protein n=1 Tax=Rhipicephalus sanguineus TaxID=34632 RepID=A0A9D4PUU5_RHISA|nr:hypothetical protein HPB52_006654 [Rhipicephalus sanguineus]